MCWEQSGSRTCRPCTVIRKPELRPDSATTLPVTLALLVTSPPLSLCPYMPSKGQPCLATVQEWLRTNDTMYILKYFERPKVL